MARLSTKVACLEARQANWNKLGVRKSSSPCVKIAMDTVNTVAIIDEGSEINCVDKEFAVRNKIQYRATKCKAYAAGSTSIRLEGET